jgi:hypothetical protein
MNEHGEETEDQEQVRERQLQAIRALRESGGVLKSADYPHWSTPEKTSQWVHVLRREADRHAARKAGFDDDSGPA